MTSLNNKKKIRRHGAVAVSKQQIYALSINYLTSVKWLPLTSGALWRVILREESVNVWWLVSTLKGTFLSQKKDESCANSKTETSEIFHR